MFRFSEFPPEIRVHAPDETARRTASPRRSIFVRPTWWRLGLLLLVATAFLIRSRDFGNPLIDSDEQFYLLAGGRLLHGTLPYVDLWDRKPAGLFLLYGAIRLLGGDGIIQYQLVAAGFVAATAMTIATIARRIAPPGAALVAGFLYIPALAMCGGEGGQAPIFFNLLVAIAAWLTIGAIDKNAAAIRRRGIATMLLLGVAMQIKYSVLAEGVYFGLVLSWLSWRADPRWPRLLADMGLWCGLALLPTLARSKGGLGAVVAPALALVIWFAASGTGSFGHEGAGHALLIRMVPPVAIGALFFPFRWPERPGTAALFAGSVVLAVVVIARISASVYCAF